METIITKAKVGMVNDLVHSARWGQLKPRIKARGKTKFR